MVTVDMVTVVMVTVDLVTVVMVTVVMVCCRCQGGDQGDTRVTIDTVTAGDTRSQHTLVTTHHTPRVYRPTYITTIV